MKSKTQIGSLSSLRLQSSLCSRVLLSVFLLAVPFLISCGGGSAAVNPPPPAVAVTISPSVVTLPAGGAQTFTPTVTGTSNTAVTWTIQEGAVGGTITSAGVYVAPQVPGTYHVVATSVADNTKSASATVTVPPIVIAISPSAVTMTSGETQTFTAAVTGSLNQMVTWSVQEGSAGGTINSSGVYLAPGAFGTYHVVATSQADPTKSGTATITVAPVSVAIMPASVGMRPGATQTFAATVTGSGNTAVTWTVQEGAAGGTITDAGFYTAPTTLGTYHVVATSVADASKSATAAVTVVQSGFTPTGSMTLDRVGHTATLLPNGQVLIAGPDSSAELYDPAAGSFARTGNMGTFHAYHTATLLPNGTVLIAGGFSATAEVYDPATGLFTPTGSMATQREAHTATLLPNGTVLIAGGFSATTELTTAEVYDPATGSFMPTGSMAFPRSVNTATLLPNGAVLVAGGFFSGSSAELYDPATGSFMPAGSLGTPRAFHTATLLPSGKVLLTGGFDRGDGLSAAELYDPVIHSFTLTGGMTQARGKHTAALLRNGDVLVAGGDSSDYCEPIGGCSLRTTELYQ